MRVPLSLRPRQLIHVSLGYWKGRTRQWIRDKGEQGRKEDREEINLPLTCWEASVTSSLMHGSTCLMAISLGITTQTPVTLKEAAVRTSASVSFNNLTKYPTSSDLVISGPTASHNYNICVSIPLELFYRGGNIRRRNGQQPCSALSMICLGHKRGWWGGRVECSPLERAWIQ